MGFVRLFAVLLIASQVLAQSAESFSPLQFSGDAKADFAAASYDPPAWTIVTIVDPSGAPDVGVPTQVNNGDDIVSGWDMEQIFFQYNPVDDELTIGIDCYVVCGDADGRLGADFASPQLTSIGGTDTEDLESSESFALSLDLDMDETPEYIIGVPADSAPGQPALPCSENPANGRQFDATNCFGLYTHANLGVIVAPGFQFAVPVTDHEVENLNPTPSDDRPDLEWRIGTFSVLRESVGATFEISGFEEFSFNINAFAGSFTDAGIGEDYIPDQNGVSQVTFPCQQFDDCGVCLGDGSSCADCLGVPNGDAVYDVCNVCAGDGTSCLDCTGTPFGDAEYDSCDVCDGDSSTCLDCLGVPNGAAVYDECDVCDGNSDTCLDCLGNPNGAAVYDECDVCDGNSDTCLDCLGNPNGDAVYDECGVCDGRSDTCLDCLGVPNGFAVYDECNVCDGDSSTCLDCLGVPNGRAVYDQCDVCDGNDDTCLDCLGIPNGATGYDECGICGGDGATCQDCAGVILGTANYDACDVCNGDGQSCRDCRNVLFGTATYDRCDVCAGDGRSCLDCAGTPFGTRTYDICDVCGGDGTSCLDCAGVPFGTSEYDECGVCNGDGSSCRVCTENCFNLGRCLLPFLFDEESGRRLAPIRTPATFGGSCKNC